MSDEYEKKPQTFAFRQFAKIEIEEWIACNNVFIVNMCWHCTVTISIFKFDIIEQFLCSYCLCWCSLFIHFLRSWISTWFSISSPMPYAPYCIAFMHEFLGGQPQKLTHTHARTHKHKWNWNIVKWTFAKIRSIN